MKNWYIIYYLFVFLGTSFNGMGQTSIADLVMYEDTLKRTAVIVLNGKNDSVRIAANSQFHLLLNDALSLEKSFKYPFDSLTTIACLTSPDNSFRIFNWNLPKDDGSFNFFGIIQLNNGKKSISPLITLNDRSNMISEPEYQVLDAENWYGALYYKIILKKSKGINYYTLLGWDGNDRFSTKKIIDVLTFDEKMEPLFGSEIFNNYKENNFTRVIFEYSKLASLSLKYETQSYTKTIHKKNKTFSKMVSDEMIVFDHLEPLDPSFMQNYRYYIPVGDRYDAFIFENGSWIFIPDVHAKNPVSDKDTNRERPKELDLLPPK